MIFGAPRARAAAGHEAMKPGSLASHPKALVLVTVVRTLRTAADWDLDSAGLRELAESVENQTAGSLARYCPVCQATACDIGCPLAEVRS